MPTQQRTETNNELQNAIIEAAERNNIDLNNASVTVVDDMIIFVEYAGSFEDYPRQPVGLLPELARGTSVPTLQATGSSWDFSGSSSKSALYTDRYLTGYQKYDLTVRNHHSSVLHGAVRKKNLLNTSLHSFEVPAGGSITVTNISASSSDKVYVSFSGPSSFGGSITGRK